MLAENHNALRTYYVPNIDRPDSQYLIPWHDFDFRINHYTAPSAPWALDRMDEQMQLPFASRQGTTQVIIVEVDGDSLVGLAVDCLAMDGASLQSLWAQLGEAYSRIESGTHHPLVYKGECPLYSICQATHSHTTISVVNDGNKQCALTA